MVAAGTLEEFEGYGEPNEKERSDWTAPFPDQLIDDALLAGMPQAIKAEISSARRIVGAVALRAVRRIAANRDGRLIAPRLLTERGAIIIGVAVIVTVAVAGIVRVIGIVVAIIRIRIAIAVTARCDSRTGRYACSSRKASIAPEAAAAIAPEFAAALRKLGVTARCELRIATAGKIGSANITLSTAEVRLHTRTATHTGTAHIPGRCVSAGLAARRLLRQNRGCHRK